MFGLVKQKEEKTLAYHEYCHNLGWDHEYEVPGDSRSRQINKHKDPIYIDAAKAVAHLCKFGEA